MGRKHFYRGSCALAAVWLAAGLLAAPPAAALLIEVDLDTASDGLLTRDTDSGFDWLDLTATTGLSYNDIVNGVDNDWVSRGFRHATAPELCGLAANAGFGIAPCPSQEIASLPGLNPLVALMGPTLNTNAVYGLFESDNPSTIRHGYAFFVRRSIDSQTSIQGAALIDPGQRIGFRGHYLLRHVPEPGTGALVGLGLAALGAGRHFRAGR